MFSSVRSRLTIWYASVLTCTLLFLSLGIYLIVKESVLVRTDTGLVELSDSFLATLDAELRCPYGRGSHPTPRDSPCSNISIRDIPLRYSATVAMCWQIRPTSPARPTSLMPIQVPSHFRSANLPGFTQHIVEILLLLCRQAWWHSLLRANFSRHREFLRLVILASLHPENALLENIRIALGWLIPFTIILASAGGYFLARKSLAPVADMTMQADHIGESTIHDRLPIQNPRMNSAVSRLLSIGCWTAWTPHSIGSAVSSRTRRTSCAHPWPFFRENRKSPSRRRPAPLRSTASPWASCTRKRAACHASLTTCLRCPAPTPGSIR